jgi:hypothetical protein
MTLLDLPTPAHRRRDRAARSGQPWTEECHAELVDLAAAGHSVPEIAERAGRTVSVVVPRLRRMLPVDERGCPEHLVLPRLRELLGQDDYDWRRAMLKDTPRPPVHQPPAIHRSGVPGLDDEDLVEVADALVRSNVRQPDLLERVRCEIRDRRLGDRLVERRVRDLVRATPTLHRREEFEMAAEEWATAGLGGPVHPAPHGWDVPPWGR